MVHQQQPYQYVEPPRRRGVKRTVFGVLGIVANAVGLVVMPMVAGFLAIFVTAIGAVELEPLDADGGTIQSSTWSVYTLAVPAEDVGTVSCEFEGAGVDPSRSADPEPVHSMDGVDYYDVYTLTAGTGEITVHCEGTEALGISELGMGGAVISAVVGLVLPIGLGVLALALTIWGVVALVRSSSPR